MAIIRTIDHDAIQEWIVEHGGLPAVIDGTTNEDTAGSLRILFGERTEDVQIITWEEFFGIFEARRLQFRFDDSADPGDEGWFADFEDRDQSLDGLSDESQLPDEVEGVENNMFPSAP